RRGLVTNSVARIDFSDGAVPQEIGYGTIHLVEQRLIGIAQAHRNVPAQLRLDRVELGRAHTVLGVLHQVVAQRRRRNGSSGKFAAYERIEHVGLEGKRRSRQLLLAQYHTGKGTDHDADLALLLQVFRYLDVGCVCTQCKCDTAFRVRYGQQPSVFVHLGIARIVEQHVAVHLAYTSAWNEPVDFELNAEPLGDGLPDLDLETRHVGIVRRIGKRFGIRAQRNGAELLDLLEGASTGGDGECRGRDQQCGAQRIRAQGYLHVGFFGSSLGFKERMNFTI